MDNNHLLQIQAEKDRRREDHLLASYYRALRSHAMTLDIWRDGQLSNLTSLNAYPERLDKFCSDLIPKGETNATTTSKTSD